MHFSSIRGDTDSIKQMGLTHLLKLKGRINFSNAISLVLSGRTNSYYYMCFIKKKTWLTFWKYYNFYHNHDVE